LHRIEKAKRRCIDGCSSLQLNVHVAARGHGTGAFPTKFDRPTSFATVGIFVAFIGMVVGRAVSFWGKRASLRHKREQGMALWRDSINQ